jgi:multidrug resistance protein, MATE family
MILDYSYKKILAVALPMMLSSFIQSIVLLTDAAFLARVSPTAFDAAGNAGLLYVTAFYALAGLADGIQILMARRIGQKKEHLIFPILLNGIKTLAIVGLVLFCILQFVIPHYIVDYSLNKELAFAQIDFLNYRSYGLGFGVITLSMQAFLVAKGKTKLIFLSAIITASCNILLDYLLIFGEMGMPKMGIQGAALASTISEGIAALFLVICFFSIYWTNIKALNLKMLEELEPSLKVVKSILKVGSPLMLQGFMALGTWVLFFTWIEQIGSFELTVSQNIRSMYFLTFVPIQGFAGTTRTYISQYMGANKTEFIPVIQKRIQLLTLLALVFFFHGALLYPETLISWINPNPEFIAKSKEILFIILPSLVIYALYSVKYQTIVGSGNTSASFIIESICILSYIIGAYLLIKVYVLDIKYVWLVEYIYFGCLAVCSLVYLHFFNWKKQII